MNVKNERARLYLGRKSSGIEVTISQGTFGSSFNKHNLRNERRNSTWNKHVNQRATPAGWKTLLKPNNIHSARGFRIPATLRGIGMTPLETRDTTASGPRSAREIDRLSNSKSDGAGARCTRRVINIPCRSDDFLSRVDTRGPAFKFRRPDRPFLRVTMSLLDTRWKFDIEKK